MRYQHHCKHCVPLGEHGNADLYFCNYGTPFGNSPTVIAQYSDDDSDCVCGLSFIVDIPDLAEAAMRANRAGLLELPGDRTEN